MKKKSKSLLLFSGGLDSILAAKILMEQGIGVLGVVFKSCFFNEEQAQKSAKEIGLKLKVIDISKEHLEIVKKPKYGYGKNMNPCIDCHLLMLKKAKELMQEDSCGCIRVMSQAKQGALRYSDADFVATGEVVGERPMSQNRNILRLLEKESGLERYLLRPLSAKLLEPTIPEKKGVVDREKLLDIQGRSRKRQLELAKKFKLKWYPTPSGGCLLTDPQFSLRLKEMLKKWPSADCDDIELLKHGRVFWEKKFLIVVGRDKEENLIIKKLKKEGDIIIEPQNIPGPITLIRGYRKPSILVINKAKDFAKRYFNKKKIKEEIKFEVF